MFKHLVVASLLFCFSSLALAADEASILNPSGLPVPRFVSLKSNEINVRVGPGKRYPIRWVFTRKHLPVSIVEEFANWRKIADHTGEGGWVHKGLLSGQRTAMILRGTQKLYARPDASARAVVQLNEGVVAEVKACIPDWCELLIAGHDGWIAKSEIWGVTREEVFEE